MLNLYEILQNILSEEVSPKEVNDAINNKYRVIINYSDAENNAPKKRIIEPYVYGLSKAGNSVFRAFQYDGDTLRGKPKWKLFRLDRVTSWQPTEEYFNSPPDKTGWSSDQYNYNGDRSMSTVLSQVDFSNNNDNGNNSYSPNDKLNKERLRTDKIKRSTPINISQMQEPKINPSGPVAKDSDNNVDNKETITPNIRGAITTNVDNKEKENIDLQNNDDFQKMLQRNMDITKKEKERRGFNINKNEK